MKDPQTLQEAITYFDEPANCREYLAARRWPDGVVCPRCGSKNVVFYEKYERWHCREKHDAPQFTLKTGTIFEDSPISLGKWLTAMWMIVNCKNGVSSHEIHRAIGVTQKSAWFMLHRLREALRPHGFGNRTKLGGPENEVEVDQSFVGPKPKNMHKGRKLRYNQQREAMGFGGIAVQGILDRDARQIRTQVVPDLKRETLQTEILKNVKYGSSVYTDDAVIYDRLNWRYVHDFVNHAETYVKGRVHTNGLENFWSLLKRNLRGTYVAVEPFHLDRYLDEQMFRYNNRGGKKREERVSDAQRFDLALSQIVGKRLTYAKLTGKMGPSEAF
jgi:transposase-like protein